LKPLNSVDWEDFTHIAKLDGDTELPADYFERVLGEFEREGFAAFRDAWLALDALRGRPARVLLDREVISGTACGVDQEGALLLDTGQQVRRFVSGEASLRVNEGEP